jgi:hypothetical protein
VSASRPSAETLGALRWSVDLADRLLTRDQPDHPARRALPDAAQWLDSEIARSRNPAAELRAALAELDLIGTVAAATILNCKQRRAQQLADELGGQKINGGTYVFPRAAVTAYAERQRH